MNETTPLAYSGGAFFTVDPAASGFILFAAAWLSLMLIAVVRWCRTGDAAASSTERRRVVFVDLHRPPARPH
jgi:hypothetical protein